MTINESKKCGYCNDPCEWNTMSCDPCKRTRAMLEQIENTQATFCETRSKHEHGIVLSLVHVAQQFRRNEQILNKTRGLVLSVARRCGVLKQVRERIGND